MQQSGGDAPIMQLPGAHLDGILMDLMHIGVDAFTRALACPSSARPSLNLLQREGPSENSESF
eukprot:12245935-Alexandrium_andersonii.AAC.1